MNAGQVLAVEKPSGASGDAAVAEAVGDAIQEHAAAIGRVCMALLGDRAAVEAALERVAREAASKGLPAGRSAKVFLMGLAHRACTTQLSKLPSRKDEAPTTERMGDAAAAGEARTALAKLKPTEREAVVLHLVGGLTSAEVAEACGLPPTAAKDRIGRALAQLAQSKESGR
jgi:RNA polymerase sigma-70 factor (ECF subfamily)